MYGRGTGEDDNLLGVALALKNFEDDEAKETNLQLVSDRCRESVSRAAQDSVKAIQERNRRENLERYGCDCPAAKCYKTCQKIMANTEPSEFWNWWGESSPPDPQNRTREVLPPGVPSYKSTSRSKRKRKKKPTFKNLYMET